VLHKDDWNQESLKGKLNQILVVLVVFKYLKKTLSNIEVICIELNAAHLIQTLDSMSDAKNEIKHFCGGGRGFDKVCHRASHQIQSWLCLFDSLTVFFNL